MLMKRNYFFPILNKTGKVLEKPFSTKIYENPLGSARAVGM